MRTGYRNPEGAYLSPGSVLEQSRMTLRNQRIPVRLTPLFPHWRGSRIPCGVVLSASQMPCTECPVGAPQRTQNWIVIETIGPVWGWLLRLLDNTRLLFEAELNLTLVFVVVW